MRILGISTLHDSSVAIIDNGKLEFFCKEERLSRKKRDKYPILALEQALKKVQTSIVKSIFFFISLSLFINN